MRAVTWRGVNEIGVEDVPEDVQESLDSIRRAGQQLDETVTIIGDLVDVAGGSTGVTEHVDVRRLLAEEVEAARDLVREPNVRLNLTGTARVTCMADSGRLRSAVRALLRHAMTHAPHGSEVHTATTWTPAGVQVAVRHHLPVTPVDPEPATVLRDGGLMRDAEVSVRFGLGLVSAFARAHGGQLVVYAAGDGGIEARLELPFGPPTHTE